METYLNSLGIRKGRYHRHPNVTLVQMLLTMLYNTQNYWVFGLCVSSGIQETREHHVSETGSVLVLR
jgi:hypothetical protein